MALTPQQRRRQRFNQLLFMQMSMAAYASTKASWTPLELFRYGEPGGWWDPSDFSTMFQDSAGTTPVTAVEQPVGRILDKSGRGNHRTQSTSAARPTLSARYNLHTKTDQLNDAAWTKTNITATADAGVDPYTGTQNVDLLVATAASGQHTCEQSSIMTAGVSYITIFYAKQSGSYRYLTLNSQGNGLRGACFDFQTGTVGSVGANVTASSMTLLPDGGYLCSLTGVAAFAGIAFAINNADTGSFTSFAGDNSSGFYIGRVDTRVANDGTGLPAYQRVNTSTDYDTSGFPMYLRYDGTDDFMQTASVDFSATDKMSVFAGARKLADPTEDVFMALGSSSSHAGFECQASAFSSSPKGFAIQTMDPVFSYGAGYVNNVTAPATRVYSATVNRGAASLASAYTMSLNGVAQSLATTGAKPTGNFGNLPLYFGARAGTSLFFNGREYQTIIRGAASTATEIAAAESYVNGKTRAY